MDLSFDAALEPSCSPSVRSKVNETLVEVARRTWPNEWPTFLQEVVSRATRSPEACENSLKILTVFSEDILDFGEQEMTSMRVTLVRQSLQSDFKAIYDLCVRVLFEQHRESVRLGVDSRLSEVVLSCLRGFIRWNSAQVIFENTLPLASPQNPEQPINVCLPIFLLQSYWPKLQLRTLSVECLGEAFTHSEIPQTELRSSALQTWTIFLDQVSAIPDQAFQYESSLPSNIRDFWERLFQQISIAVASFLKNHFFSLIGPGPHIGLGSDGSGTGVSGTMNGAGTISGPGTTSGVAQWELQSLNVLARLTTLPSEENFKICLEAWHHFATHLKKSVKGALNAGNVFLGTELEIGRARLAAYQPALNDVRRLMLARMARPPEVLLKFDEQSESVEREYHQDTDEIALYHLMKDTLILFAHLGERETEDLILSTLKEFTDTAQRDRSSDGWNPMALNRLCWAVGAISGALAPEREKMFIVSLLKLLLTFCGVKPGRQNKALIASMIMHITSQYPKFIKSNDSLLETVVDKNFEFACDEFGGVAEMACETYYKVALNCSEKLAVIYSSKQPKVRYLDRILLAVPQILQKLSLREKLTVYHSTALVVAAIPDPQLKQRALEQLLQRPLETWRVLLSTIAAAMAAGDPGAGSSGLEKIDLQTLKKVVEIIQIFQRCAEAVRSLFTPVIDIVFEHLLKLYADFGRELIALDSVRATHAVPKEWRKIRRNILSLTSIMLKQSNRDRLLGIFWSDQQSFGNRVELISEKLIVVVFREFKSSPIFLRDPEVILLATTLVEDFHAEIGHHFPSIIAELFLPALDMVNKDYDSHQEVREALFRFVNVCTEKCLPSLIALPADVFKMLVCSIIFAFQDDKPQIAHIGLTSAHTLFKNLRETATGGQPQAAAFAPRFAEEYYCSFLREVIAVLTDTLHTSGFKEQSSLLQELVLWACSPIMNIPGGQMSKQGILTELATLLLSNFNNLKQTQVEVFVLRIFASAEASPAEFARIAQDLVIELREVGGEDAMHINLKNQLLQTACPI